MCANLWSEICAHLYFSPVYVLYFPSHLENKEAIIDWNHLQNLEDCFKFSQLVNLRMLCDS